MLENGEEYPLCNVGRVLGPDGEYSLCYGGGGVLEPNGEYSLVKSDKMYS